MLLVTDNCHYDSSLFVAVLLCSQQAGTKAGISADTKVDIPAGIPLKSMLWRYRCRSDGKVGIFALGRYDELSISDVRGAREEARSLVAEGIHPAHQSKQEMRKASLGRAHTFEKIAHAWMAESSPQWSGSYERQIRRAFEMHAFGELGETPIKRISPADLRSVIKKAAEAAPTNALMLLQWCSSVLQYAVLHDLVESDPAATMPGLVKRPAARHRSPLYREAISGLLGKIEANGSGGSPRWR